MRDLLKGLRKQVSLPCLLAHLLLVLNIIQLLTIVMSSIMNSMCLQYRENLRSRLELLAKLHWCLPHALTAAEELLRDKELPRLDKQARALKKLIQVSGGH